MAEQKENLLLQRLATAETKLLELGWIRTNSGEYVRVGATVCEHMNEPFECPQCRQRRADE